ncbi:unnamed protein product [Rhizopus stolonifer]
MNDLPQFVWTEQLNANTQDEERLCNTVKFLLTSLANICSTTAINTKPYKGYECTFWVEHVPSSTFSRSKQECYHSIGVKLKPSTMHWRIWTSGFRREVHGMLMALVMTKATLKEWF